VRRRWLLITMRLSASSFAGTERTLVAVGMVSERSMFFAITAFAPRIDLTLSPSVIFTGAGAVAAGAGRAGAGCAGGRTWVAFTCPLPAAPWGAVRAFVAAMPWLTARGVGL